MKFAMSKFLPKSPSRILVRADAPEPNRLAAQAPKAAIPAIRPPAHGKVPVTPFPVGATARREPAAAAQVPTVTKPAPARLGALALVIRFTAALPARRVLSKAVKAPANPTAAVMSAQGIPTPITAPTKIHA